MLKFSRADRAFGVGPSLPNHFNNIGLNNIDIISWFWGGIGNKALEMDSIENKLKSVERNLDLVKEILPKSKSLTAEEKKGIVDIYHKRLSSFKEKPELLKVDMSVKGLPVFIVKGEK